MPLIMTSEVNEDTRGKGKSIPHHQAFKLILIFIVLGYDPLLSPQFLQSELPIVRFLTSVCKAESTH